MGDALPDWIEHYREVPSWVLFVEIDPDRMLWVNDRLAGDLDKPREWFVGRTSQEIWTDSHERHTGRQALAARRTIDVIGDGSDLQGRWRWLDARFTPVDDRHLLIVCQDITSRIKLSGLRLVLGYGFSDDAAGGFGEGFARKLIEGASLEEICAEEGAEPVEILGRLGRLIGDPQPASQALEIPPAVSEPPPAPAPIPDWVAQYWELPSLAILLDYPALTVLWVNRAILERNRLRGEDVVGRDADSVWHNVAEWRELIDRTMNTGQAIDTVHQGHNLTGKQQWLSVHTTPVGGDRLLILSEDITADVRLQALRLLLGIDPQESANNEASISEAFARLLLEGASVANIAAGLGITAQEVRGRAATLLGRSHD